LLPKQVNPTTFKNSKPLHPLLLSVSFDQIPCSMARMVLPEGESLSVRELVRLYTSEGDAGIFRVTATTPVYPGNMEVTLAHGICILNDTRIKGSGYIEGTFGSVIADIISHQEGNTFAVGYFADGETVRIKYDNDTLLDLLKQACQKAKKQRLTVDQSSATWILGSESIPDHPTAEGRFARNLGTVSMNVDDDNLCTRLVVEHTNWETGEKTYTYYDADTISEYGVVEKPWSVPYGATEEDITAYANEFLEMWKEPSVSIDIDASDLYDLTGQSIDRLKIGDMLRCCMPDYKTTVNCRMRTVTHPDVYGNPLKRRITYSNSPIDTSGLLVELKRQNESNGRRIGGAASSAEAARWGINLTHERLEELDQYTKATFNAVGIELNAQKATVGIHATNITTLFEDVERVAQITGDVSVQLDAQNRTINLKADQKAVDDLTNEVTTLGTDVSVGVDGLRATIQQNDKTLSELNATIAGLEHWVTDGADNVSELVNTVRGLESIVSAAGGQISTLTNTADGLTSIVNGQGEQLATFKTRIDEITSEVKGANGSITSLSVYVDEISGVVKAAGGKIGSLVVSADEISGKITDQTKAFSQLLAKIDEISANVQAANGDIGKITVQSNEIAQTIVSADKRITSQLKLIAGVIELQTKADGTAVSLRLNALDNMITAQAGTIANISGDTKSIGETLSTITGSTIWQNRESITGVVGNMSVGADGKIYIKDGSGLMITKGSASYGVYDSNSLTAGIIVNKINGGTATIKAERINLEGYVTADKLSTEIANIMTQFSGKLSTGELEVTKGPFSFQGYNIVRRSKAVMTSLPTFTTATVTLANGNQIKVVTGWADAPSNHRSTLFYLGDE